MTAKTFFQDVLHAEGELKVLRARVRHFEELGLMSGISSSGVGSRSNGSSRVEMAAVGAVDATKALDEQIRYYTRIISRAQRIIKQIPQEKYRHILDYRYLSGWSFRSISDELGYNDPNSVYRAHGWALSEAQKIINREEAGENGKEKQ